jgi:hypothetical protein
MLSDNRTIIEANERPRHFLPTTSVYRTQDIWDRGSSRDLQLKVSKELKAEESLANNMKYQILSSFKNIVPCLQFLIKPYF